MKSFLDRFSANTSRFEIFLLSIPFILWVFCFWNFFSGHLRLEEDAVSYAQHIIFYTNNLSRGVYPLWDPTWLSGAPNDFFLRRIGDVNPLLFLMVFLKWLGIPPASAYLVFLGFYYFLAGWAFYLITRFLLAERFFAFSAYVLFLFSSWGSELFYNYIIIIFVPIIWFFYFLLKFARSPQKGYFLGLCFCVGIIVTTYIPFFFLTILVIFTFLYVLFYGQVFVDLLKRSFLFFRKNKVFTCFCIGFLLVSCVPALIFYKESKGGEFVLPGRHAGADDSSSAVAVGLQNVASGDIISHGYFDRIFDDHSNLDMGDIYIPYVFFLVLLATFFAPSMKLIFFLLFNILALSLITITSAAGVHHFLYEHILLFKFIRNIYYFFWLAMLPLGILLSVTAFKSLLTAIDGSAKKTSWFIYVAICHFIFAVFLFKHQGVLWGAWVAIFVSFSYFFIYFYCKKRVSYPIGFCLILLAVFFQSAQVYMCLDKKLYLSQNKNISPQQAMSGHEPRVQIYYASHWFAVLAKYIDPQVLKEYRQHQFVFYDNVTPYTDSPEFFNTFQTSLDRRVNLAFLSNAESGSGDWRGSPNAGDLADDNPPISELSVLPSDANTWILLTHLSNSRFLVINDNYNTDWHAFINGHPVRLLRANVAFKGLWVPCGDSKIVLRFSNPRCYLFHFVLIAFFAGIFLYLLVLLRKPSESYV